MYSPQNILSENLKCGRSINLPIRGHCRPTEICSKLCYAKTGRCRMPHCTKKQDWVSSYLAGQKEDPSLARLIQESGRHPAIRLSGTGDIKLEHIPGLIKVAKACPNTQFWGMTRKLEIANAIMGAGLANLRVLVTADASSPESVWKYQGAMCYGPRRAQDSVPDDDRIKVVFPYHFMGQVREPVPRHRKDCLAVWHDIPGCLSCGRCWSW